MKTDLFQSCGHCWVFQICLYIECSTFTASSFRIWNSSTAILSPPVTLFIVMQKCKSKPQWGTISHRSEWLLSKVYKQWMLETVRRKGNALTLLVGMQTTIATIKNSVEISLKTGNRTAIWPSNPPAGYILKERATCTPMFITALFTIARTWKQPRCPLADEWVRKLWYICTMKYYSAFKKNAFESVLMRWMKLEPII